MSEMTHAWSQATQKRLNALARGERAHPFKALGDVVEEIDQAPDEARQSATAALEAAEPITSPLVFFSTYHLKSAVASCEAVSDPRLKLFLIRTLLNAPRMARPDPFDSPVRELRERLDAQLIKLDSPQTPDLLRLESFTLRKELPTKTAASLIDGLVARRELIPSRLLWSLLVVNDPMFEMPMHLNQRDAALEQRAPLFERLWPLLPRPARLRWLSLAEQGLKLYESINYSLSLPQEQAAALLYATAQDPQEREAALAVLSAANLPATEAHLLDVLNESPSSHALVIEQADDTRHPALLDQLARIYPKLPRATQRLALPKLQRSARTPATEVEAAGALTAVQTSPETGAVSLVHDDATHLPPHELQLTRPDHRAWLQHPQRSPSLLWRAQLLLLGDTHARRIWRTPWLTTCWLIIAMVLIQQDRAGLFAVYLFIILPLTSLACVFFARGARMKQPQPSSTLLLSAPIVVARIKSIEAPASWPIYLLSAGLAGRARLTLDDQRSVTSPPHNARGLQVGDMIPVFDSHREALRSPLEAGDTALDAHGALRPVLHPLTILIVLSATLAILAIIL